jgi:class 3 adenylate cyclase
MVGSTDVRVRLGADGERLLRLQETLAREAVGAQAGSVIKSLGDGTMAVFEAAAGAGCPAAVAPSRRWRSAAVRRR